MHLECEDEHTKVTTLLVISFGHSQLIFNYWLRQLKPHEYTTVLSQS